ncbi:DUF596 domain-containing protein [Leucobacter viscericola]|uniref:DUF596 domain-containing protein n=1 Tax=Leucobacter viscericola TaxID=2714935 RepID=A0A6G7XDB8_9MICO|nr:DUF596 domain-containing protein [Leucobacter viscericola]QIK62555.1 DUF596 domain-containing protein [Leucobacter viscericola]
MNFSVEQLLWIFEVTEEDDLNGIWIYFDSDSSDIRPPLGIPSMSFEERRGAFIDLLTVLLHKGYIRFVQQWEEGEPELAGSISEQIEVLNASLPHSREELKVDGHDDIWFIARCPVDIVWSWPGRNPEPLFPGHNPRFSYIDDYASWDGRIDPEWSNWKFTQGRLRLDDFSSEEEASAFWKAHPNYFQDTPRIERIIE